MDLESYYTHYYRDLLGLPNWREKVQMRVDRVDEEDHTRRLEQHVDLRGKRILDVGCGSGGLLVSLALRGAELVGAEPEKEGVQLASQRTRGRVVRALGEVLPFRAGTFDLVTVISVLEHTPHPRELLRELVRVLRPGGTLRLHCPNYFSFHEHHYRLFWFPYLPRPLARLYLRLRGRPTAYLDHIYYLNPSSIRRMLQGLPVRIRNIPLELLMDKLAHPEAIRSRWRTVAQWLSHIGAAQLAVRLRLLLGWDIDWLVVKQK